MLARTAPVAYLFLVRCNDRDCDVRSENDLGHTHRLGLRSHRHSTRGCPLPSLLADRIARSFLLKNFSTG